MKPHFETFHIFEMKAHFETFHILEMKAHFEKEPHFGNESIIRSGT